MWCGGKKPTGDEKNLEERLGGELSPEFFRKFQLLSSVWEACSSIFLIRCDVFAGPSPVRLPSSPVVSRSGAGVLCTSQSFCAPLPTYGACAINGEDRTTVLAGRGYQPSGGP